MVGYFVALAIFTATFALFSLGLNLQWGYTGLVNFGHIAFMTIGAYTTVLLSINGVPLVVAVLVGTVLAAVLGLLIGLSTLRLREDYLAIVTIGVSEVVRLVALNEEWLTRGTRGVYSYPLPLANFEPNLLVKLIMIACLTALVLASGWQLWQWFTRQLKSGAESESAVLVPSRLRQGLILAGYVGCLALLETSLWRGFERGLSGWQIGLAIAATAIGVAFIYARTQQPLKVARAQSWPVHLILAGATVCVGLVLVVYHAGVLSLYDYTYKAGLMWLLLLTLGLVFWQLQLWVNSPWGRVLKAIREDEEVARALGKNVFWYKLQSLMLGGAIAGIAGAFYAWQLTFINPDGFIPLITFQAWTIVVLGGSGNNVGTLLGAAIFWAYNTVTRFVLPGLVPLDDARLGAFRVMIIGLLLVVLMMWRPQGILGKKEELTLGR